MTGAYSFVCAYGDTDALLARLTAISDWEWHKGDSSWYGDYLRCIPFDGVRIRIVDFPKPGPNEGEWRYDADLRFWSPTSGRTTDGSTIDAAFRTVLRKIPAHDIAEIEPFD